MGAMMGLETAASIGALNALWPLGSDPRSQGDDHLRLIKKVMKADIVPKGGGAFTGAIEVGDYAGGDPSVSASQLGAGGLKLRAQSGVSASAPFASLFKGSAEVIRMQADGQLISNGGTFRATGAKPDAVLEAGTLRAGSTTAGAGNGGFTLDTDGTGSGIQFFEAGSVAASAPMFRVSLGATATIRMEAGGAIRNATGAVGTISDRRVKQAVADLGPQLADLMRLRPVSYELRDLPGAGRLAGFVAQELEEVKPGLVTRDEDGLLGVKLLPMVVLLVKALQELAARVDGLEASGDGVAA